MSPRFDALARRLVAAPPEGSPNGCTPPAGVGCAVRRGGVTEWAAFGDRGDGSPLTVETAHDLASVTKVVATTTALVVLVSGGALGLDDPVRRFVPGFCDPGVSVRQLLAHRGGLAEWYPLYLTAGTRDEAIDVAVRMPLRYPPDSARHYSDLGFLLLGRVVERASGLGLGAAFDELVAGPLRLTSTRFAHPAGADVATSALDDRVEQTMLDTDEPYAVGHRSAEFTRWRTGPIVGDVNDGNAFHACGGTAGHAGLFGTLGDLVAWGEALATGGGPWRPEVLAEFVAAGPDAGQALGFRRYEAQLDGEPVTVVGHPGFVGCAVGFVPGRDVAVAVVSNRLVTTGTPVPTELLFGRLLDQLDRSDGDTA